MTSDDHDGARPPMAPLPLGIPLSNDRPSPTLTDEETP